MTKSEIRKQRQAQHAAREASRLEAGDTRTAEERRLDRARLTNPSGSWWIRSHRGGRERTASREEQHARYIDCGPGAWDDCVMRGAIKKPVVLVPGGVPRAVLMALSKAAIADIAWSLAARCSGEADSPSVVLQVLAEEAQVVLSLRGDLVPEALRKDGV